MKIDNLERLSPYLDFSDPDLFYFCSLVRRKKDIRGVKGHNNKDRAIAWYYISSLPYLREKMPEIRNICDATGARAGIKLNRRSYRKSAFETQKKMLVLSEEEKFNNFKGVYSKVVEKNASEPQKRWFLDIDQTPPHTDLIQIGEFLSTLLPLGRKDLFSVPSKTGLHFFCSPFDRKRAEPFLAEREIEIKTDATTNLYIP